MAITSELSNSSLHVWGQIQNLFFCYDTAKGVVATCLAYLIHLSSYHYFSSEMKKKIDK